MSRKTSPETVTLICDLYHKGIPLREIARRTRVSYRTVQGYTTVREQGFASRKDYDQNFATEKGFLSPYEYQEHLAKQRGLRSYSEYREELARKQGFASHFKYQKQLVKKRKFASYTVYQEYLAMNRGFPSAADYQKHCRKRQQKSRTNRELSDLIRTGLELWGKNQAWLAKELGVSKEAIRCYIHGKYLPRQELLEKLQAVLGIDNRYIDGLLEE